MCKKILLIGLIANMSALAAVQPAIPAVQSTAQKVQAASQKEEHKPGVHTLPKVAEVRVCPPVRVLQPERRELQIISKGRIAEFRAWLNSGTPAANAVSIGLFVGAAIPIILVIPVLLSLKSSDGNVSQEQLNQAVVQLGTRFNLGSGVAVAHDSSAGVSNTQVENFIKEFTTFKATTESRSDELYSMVANQVSLDEKLAKQLNVLTASLQDHLNASPSAQTAGSSIDDDARISALEKQVRTLTDSVHQSNQTKADKLTMFTQKLNAIEERLAVDESQLKAFQDKSAGYKHAQSADEQ
jgi:hypothetical protein